MSGQKRPAGSELEGGPPCKKNRGVTAKTVDKWIAEMTRHSTRQRGYSTTRQIVSFTEMFDVHSFSG